MKFYIIFATFTITVLNVLSAATTSKTCCKCKISMEQKELESVNKALVLEFYQKVFGDQDYDAVYDYIGNVFIQHTPTIANGRDAFRAILPELLDGVPKGKEDIRRTAAEGDLVWLHQRATREGIVKAIVNIYRLENGKIVEHWDVQQEVPGTSANNNTMF